MNQTTTLEILIHLYLNQDLQNNTNKNGVANVEIVVPLKYLSKFRRTLEMHLINRIFLDLTWSENCVICEAYKVMALHCSSSNSFNSR